MGFQLEFGHTGQWKEMTFLFLSLVYEPHLKCQFIVSFGMTYVPLSGSKLFLFQGGGVNECKFLNAQDVDLSNTYSKKNAALHFLLPYF